MRTIANVGVCLGVAMGVAVAGCSRQGGGAGADAASEPAPRSFSLADFESFPAEGDWSPTAGGFATSGEPKGYVYSREPIGPGVLRYEYRFPPGEDGGHVGDPNTGLLLFIREPHKTWPECVEVQGKQSEAGRVKANGGMAEPDVLHDEAALAEAPRPPGEWNRVEVTVTKEGLSASLNGRRTASAICPTEKGGPFGLQAERNPVEFRNVTFTPRPPAAR